MPRDESSDIAIPAEMNFDDDGMFPARQGVHLLIGIQYGSVNWSG
jgi:hypothetical protein